MTDLAAFINEAVTCRVVAENKKRGEVTYSLTNCCSVPFVLHRGKSIHTLAPFTTRNFTLKEGSQPRFIVDNMWHANEQHPTVVIAID